MISYNKDNTCESSHYYDILSYKFNVTCYLSPLQHNKMAKLNMIYDLRESTYIKKAVYSCASKVYIIPSVTTKQQI